MMHVRNRYLLLCDLVVFAVSLLAAYAVRLEGWDWLATDNANVLLAYLLLVSPIRVLINLGLGMYARLWHMASLAELERIAAASVIGGTTSIILGYAVVARLTNSGGRPPIGVLVLDALFVAVGMTAPRVAFRLVRRPVSYTPLTLPTNKEG